MTVVSNPWVDLTRSPRGRGMMRVDGVVTRTEFSGAQFGSANSGSGRGCGSPSPERFVSEDAERAAGGEMALDVEGVEDYRVNRQESLG